MNEYEKSAKEFEALSGRLPDEPIFIAIQENKESLRLLCPKCKVDLVYVPNCPTGWSSEHLACPICDGTFNEGDGTYLTVDRFLPKEFKVKMPDGTPFEHKSLGIIFCP